MKQPFAAALPAVPTAGDVCYRDDGTQHFCFTDGVWTQISGGAAGGASRIDYGSACVLLAGNTNWNSVNLPGAVRGPATDLHDNPTAYFGRCKWDLIEVEYDGTIHNSWTGLDFANAADLYTYIRANFTPHPVVPNTAAYHGYVRFYDVVDDTIPPIDKIWGINTFFAMLKGRRRYRDTLLGAISPPSWNQFPTWFAGLCNQNIGFGPGHSYSLGDEGALWVPRTDAKVHGLPAPGFVTAPQTVSNRRVWDWGSSDFTPLPALRPYQNIPSVGERRIYCSLYLNNISLWSWNTTIGSSFMQMVSSRFYSTVALYALEDSADPNFRAVFLKPYGIDRLGLNWFDQSTYDLCALYTKKFSDPIMRPISLVDMNYPSKDLFWIPKTQWSPPHSGGAMRLSGNMVGKGNYTTQFFLRDKVSKKISPASKARVVLSQRHRDAPFKYEVKR